MLKIFLIFIIVNVITAIEKSFVLISENLTSNENSVSIQFKVVDNSPEVYKELIVIKYEEFYLAYSGNHLKVITLQSRNDSQKKWKIFIKNTKFKFYSILKELFECELKDIQHVEGKIKLFKMYDLLTKFPLIRTYQIIEKRMSKIPIISNGSLSMNIYDLKTFCNLSSFNYWMENFTKFGLTVFLIALILGVIYLVGKFYKHNYT